MERISPRVDLAFKKIFGVEENKDLLISLINSIVSEEDQVSEITLLNPYNSQNFKNDKLSILDIKARNHEGKQFNIEMQISDEANYEKRAVYYLSKLYTDQLIAGQSYSTLAKSIAIHILNFNCIIGSDKYHHAFHFTDKETGFAHFNNLEIHTIELKKFIGNSDKTLAEIGLKVKNALDMWVTFLTKNDLLVEDNLPKTLDDPNLKKAIHVLNIINLTPDERSEYEDRLKWMMIQADTLEKYEQKGMEKGMEKGLAKGREEGEAEAKIAIAKNMLAKDIGIEIISEITGLDMDDIARINHSA